MSHPQHENKTFHEHAAHMQSYAIALTKWMILAVLVGGCGGVIGALFHIGVEEATLLREHRPWLLYLLPDYPLCHPR